MGLVLTHLSLCGVALTAQGEPDSRGSRSKPRLPRCSQPLTGTRLSVFCCLDLRQGWKRFCPCFPAVLGTKEAGPENSFPAQRCPNEAYLGCLGPLSLTWDLSAPPNLKQGPRTCPERAAPCGARQNMEAFLERSGTVSLSGAPLRQFSFSLQLELTHPRSCPILPREVPHSELLQYSLGPWSQKWSPQRMFSPYERFTVADLAIERASSFPQLLSP